MLRVITSIQRLFKKCEATILFKNNNRFAFSQADPPHKKQRRKDLFELSPRRNIITSKLKKACKIQNYSQAKLHNIFNFEKQIVGKFDYALYFYQTGKLIKNSNIQITSELTSSLHKTIRILSTQPQKANYLAYQTVASYLFFMLYQLLLKAPSEMKNFEKTFALIYKKQLNSWKGVIKLLNPNLIEQIRSNQLQTKYLDSFYKSLNQMFPEPVEKCEENANYQIKIQFKQKKKNMKRKNVISYSQFENNSQLTQLKQTITNIKQLDEFLARYKEQNAITIKLRSLQKIQSNFALNNHISVFFSQLSLNKLNSLTSSELEIVVAFVHFVSRENSKFDVRVSEVCTRLFNYVFQQINSEDNLPYHYAAILKIWIQASKSINQFDLEDKTKVNLKKYLTYLAKYQKQHFTNLIEPIIGNQYFKNSKEQYLDLKLIDEIMKNQISVQELFNLFMLNPKAIDYIPLSVSNHIKPKSFACIAIMVAYQIRQKQNYKNLAETYKKIYQLIISDGQYGYIKLLQRFSTNYDCICQMLIKSYGYFYFKQNSQKYTKVLHSYVEEYIYIQHQFELLEFYPPSVELIDEIKNAIKLYHIFLQRANQIIEKGELPLSKNFVNNLILFSKQFSRVPNQSLFRLMQTEKHRKILDQSIYQESLLGQSIFQYFNTLNNGQIISYFCNPQNRNNFKIWVLHFQHLIDEAINKPQVKGNYIFSYFVSYLIDSSSPLLSQRLLQAQISEFDSKLLNIHLKKPETIFEDDKHEFQNIVLIIKSIDLYKKHKKLVFQYLTTQKMKFLSIFQLQKLLLHSQIYENDFTNILRMLWEQYLDKITKNNLNYLSLINIFNKMTEKEAHYVSNSYARRFFAKIIELSEEYEGKMLYRMYGNLFVKNLNQSILASDTKEPLSQKQIVYLRKVKNNIFVTKNYANYFYLVKFNCFYQANQLPNEKQLDQLLKYLKDHLQTDKIDNFKILLMSFLLNHKNLQQSFCNKFLQSMYEWSIEKQFKISYLITGYFSRQMKQISSKYNERIQEISQNYNGLSYGIGVNSLSQGINQKLTIKLIEKKAEGLIYYEYSHNIIVFASKYSSMIEKSVIQFIYSYFLNVEARKINIIELDRAHNEMQKKAHILQSLSKFDPESGQNQTEFNQKLTLRSDATELLYRKMIEKENQKKRDKQEEMKFKKN